MTLGFAKKKSMGTKSHFSGGVFDGIELELTDPVPPSTIELGVVINGKDYVALNQTVRYRLVRTEDIALPKQRPYHCGQLETHWYFEFDDEVIGPSFGVHAKPATS